MGKFRKIRRDFNKVAHAAQDTVKYLKNNPALVNAGLMAADMIMPGSSGMIKSAYKQGKGAYNQGKGYYKQGKALKNDYKLNGCKWCQNNYNLTFNQVRAIAEKYNLKK